MPRTRDGRTTYNLDVGPGSGDFTRGRGISVPRVAHERGVSEDTVRVLVRKYTTERNLGLRGEPRVNVSELNLALDDLAAKHEL